MTLAEATEIFAYWEQSPPPHLLLQTIARLLGWTPHSQADRQTPVLSYIIAAPPPGLAVVQGGDLGMPPPVLDITVMRARNLRRHGG